MNIPFIRSATTICKHVGGAMLFAIAFGSPNAIAATIPDVFVIDVDVINSLGVSTFAANRNGATYSFEAAVEIRPGAPRVKADLYFGILSPAGTISYSWVKRDGSYVLERGMTPISEDIDLATPSSITVNQMLATVWSLRFRKPTHPECILPLRYWWGLTRRPLMLRTGYKLK